MDDAPGAGVRHTYPMAKEKYLYIGEWIAAVGKAPADICRETGIPASYLSALISGKKHSPSTPYLYKIARAIGLRTPGPLYAPPPPRAHLEAAKALLDPFPTPRPR